jgi:hypothetical protein
MHVYLCHAEALYEVYTFLGYCLKTANLLVGSSLR